MNHYHDLLILMVVLWTAGKLFRLVGLPIVFGELLGGILVGPALLGIVDADNETIKVVAELGIFFLMLHAGLKTDHNELFSATKKSVFISLGGMALPFAMGYFASLLFGYDVQSALFVGLGLSITAIALAVRLFKDCQIENTNVSHQAIGAAVLNDIIGLIIFSVLIRISQGDEVNAMILCGLLLKVIAFFAVVLIGGVKTAPLFNRFIYLGNKGFTITLIMALLLGLAAEAIGLHFIIGAFLAGLFIREEVIDQETFDKIEDRVYGLSYSFFGPIFIASLAFHLDFAAINEQPLFLMTILFIAITGKVVGCGVPALLQKNSPLEALLIGLAMNNRGAVELIIASIGLELGIIDQTIFSILVIMAFCTTLFSVLATAPFAKELRAAE